MTILLRDGTTAIADTLTASIPHLAELFARMGERANPADPYEADRATFDAAEAEMKMIRQSRGYSDLPVASLPQRNFLLFGVPVICAGD